MKIDEMNTIFNTEDRQSVFDYIHLMTQQCDKIVSLVQVGSGAVGYHDALSDLDFVIALDKDESMVEVMDCVHEKLAEKYEFLYFKQAEERHLQVYLLSNLLEVDIGYGGYEHAAAIKPAFKVLFDHSGVVEEKMTASRAWMDDAIYSGKRKKDVDFACDAVWAHLMHASAAIKRGKTLRALGELAFVRDQYLALVGDRCHLESNQNRELDDLPEEEKAAIRSTFVTGESQKELQTSLLNLTKVIYRELKDAKIPVTEEMLYEYYQKTEN